MPAFYLSCLLAFSGGHMFNYGVILYLQEEVGAPALAGLGFALCFGPPLVFGWFAGAWCDRVSPLRLIHGAQALFAAGLGLLLWADGNIAQPAARVPLVLLAAGLAGVAWSFVAPARMATLGRLVDPARIRPASVLFNLLVMLGFGLGPLLIGVARQADGWPAVFLTAMAGFVLASLLVLPLRIPPPARADSAHVLADIRAGLRAVQDDPLLAQLLLAAILIYLLMGPMQLLLPRLAQDRLLLSEIGRGSFLGLIAVALILGGVAALALVRRLHHGRAIFLGLGAAGLLFALLAGTRSPLLASALLLAAGACGGMVVSLIVAGLQAHVPDALRGRVMSMYTMSSQVVPAASGLAAGLGLKFCGLLPTMVGAGMALVAAAAAGALLMPRLRRNAG
jgi:MFS family permease